MNRTTLIYIALGVGAAIIVVLLLLPDAATRPLRKATMQWIGPALITAEKPVVFFRGMNSKLTTLDQAVTQVKNLREQVSELQIRNQLLADKAAENARLREMLGFQAASQYELMPCRVISREPSSWWDSVQVNIGDEQNDELYNKYKGKYELTPDEPVVSPRGVVGKTGTVSHYVTDVILLVNENCAISANIEGTHDQGIVQGQGNFEEGKTRVRVDYLPKDSQVQVGQFVITSGLGPYFPAGLRLGTVTEVPVVQKTYPTFGLYRQAVIEPTANLDQLDELFVVLGPKDKSHDAAAAADADSSKPDAH